MALNFRLTQLASTEDDLRAICYREYKSQIGFFEHREFREGVRALMIDKDKPKWTHQQVKDVTETDLDYFLSHNVDISMDTLYDIDYYPEHHIV